MGVCGGVGPVIEAETNCRLGVRFGDILFGQSGIALPLKPAFLWLARTCFRVERGGKAPVEPTHLAAPVVAMGCRPIAVPSSASTGADTTRVVKLRSWWSW
jgi:hypothetical protein